MDTTYVGRKVIVNLACTGLVDDDDDDNDGISGLSMEHFVVAMSWNFVVVVVIVIKTLFSFLPSWESNW